MGGQLGEALVDELADRVLDDQAGKLGRSVIDAELLALHRLRHRGEAFGAFGVAEQAAELGFFQLGDRALEEVAQDVEVDFVGEAVGADPIEKVGPLVGQL